MTEVISGEPTTAYNYTGVTRACQRFVNDQAEPQDFDIIKGLLETILDKEIEDHLNENYLQHFADQVLDSVGNRLDAGAEADGIPKVVQKLTEDVITLVVMRCHEELEKVREDIGLEEIIYGDQDFPKELAANVLDSLSRSQELEQTKARVLSIKEKIAAEIDTLPSAIRNLVRNHFKQKGLLP